MKERGCNDLIYIRENASEKVMTHGLLQTGCMPRLI